MTKHRWMDISQPLKNGVPEWPGDTPFSRTFTWSIEEGSTVNVSELKMSTHIGTHIDAPLHFDKEGAAVDELDLELYIGPALLIEWNGRDTLKPADFASQNLTGAERLLIRTNAWKDRRSFPKAIPAVDPALGPFLKEAGVRLLGLDLPSVDVLDSKELPGHHALASAGVFILEGLVLDNAEPGLYDFAALPLALEGADGSPVRAVIRKQ